MMKYIIDVILTPAYVFLAAFTFGVLSYIACEGFWSGFNIFKGW